MEQEFKPNIFPIMYWAIAYGVVAGLLLVLVTMLSRYVGVVWFPVFLAGLCWGGYRSYKRQKLQWHHSMGKIPANISPTQEIREAVSDIADASRDLFNQEAEEEYIQTEAVPEEEYPTASDTTAVNPEEATDNNNPPQPPPQQLG